MKRREFVKSSALITLPLLLKSCDWAIEKVKYPIYLYSDARTGHLVYESNKFTQVKAGSVETLIVGGGIAGLAAASKLQGSDYLLCELSEELGGTSSAHRSQDLLFCQGAHYDLSYPANYGPEVLQFLDELDIIKYQSWNDRWSFVDDHYLITHRRKNQCYDNGEFRKDVLAESKLKNDFLDLMRTYKNEMVLPTRLISEKHRHLNSITFLDFLNQRFELTPEFLRGVDYHMKDDYGSDTATVSALAGIHYFACRPYYDEIVELFSPPEGNNYFIKKMADRLSGDQLLKQHLVKRISETPEGFGVEIVDVPKRQVKLIKTKKVIYAGQKHALKYIYPAGHELFADNQVAPWMVVNVIIKNEIKNLGYWQNEMLTDDNTFLGFVDSDSQLGNSEYRVLTCYYCLPPSSRQDLINAEENKSSIAEMTAENLSNYFKQDIGSLIKRVDIKVMGHAMPIPKPGYLFNDKNALSQNPNIRYAGVDNARLPLLFEALDTGLQAPVIDKG
ncbi:MAG: FAD-dependent oxidoreductase [Bacteroidota bacterium]